MTEPMRNTSTAEVRVALVQARLMDAEPGADLSQAASTTWHPVAVPGDVHRALVAAGRLDDPDFGDGDDAARWVQDRAWWWHVALPPLGPVDAEERVQLVMHGLDTLAAVYLDGAQVAVSENMFLPLVLDVTERARRDAPSTLALCFFPLGPEPDLTRLRKAAYSLGWDFAPCRPTIGAWRPIELVRQHRAALASVGFRTVRVNARRTVADVEVVLDVDSWVGSSLTASVRLSAGHELVAHEDVEVSDGRTVVRLSVSYPRLWWTHDQGEPFLHDLDVELHCGAQRLSHRRLRVGVRTIVLDRTDGFRFVLNGEPLCVRGANWVPAVHAVGDVPIGRVARLLDLAVGAHMNMLRVWGGGVYESEEFYDLCDQLGLLVWQDFAFACAEYRDDDPAFVASVVAEAAAQVRRLRHRASLALWCGNNEVSMLADLLGWADGSPAQRLFDELLPGVVAAEDGATGYVPTSPQPGNRHRAGDRHAWQVWHGIDERDARTTDAWATDGRLLEPGSPAGNAFVALAHPDRYLEDEAAFVSEYGLCGAPSVGTLERWTDPEQLHLGSRQVQRRSRPGRLGPSNKHELLLAGLAGTPDDLQDWVTLSQDLQARGLKRGAEHYRRSWPDCSGQLVWQLGDCWPATSWSLVDHDLQLKPAYDAVRRAFAPVLVSVRPTGGGHEVWLTNDEPVQDELVVTVEGFAGTVLYQHVVSVDVPAGSRCLYRLARELTAGAARVTVVGAVGRIPRNEELLQP